MDDGKVNFAEIKNVYVTFLICSFILMSVSLFYFIIIFFFLMMLIFVGFPNTYGLPKAEEVNIINIHSYYFKLLSKKKLRKKHAHIHAFTAEILVFQKMIGYKR